MKFRFSLLTLIFSISLQCFSISHEVINNNDSGPGSLRDIIFNANSSDTVTFSTNLINSTINITSGEIIIDKSLTILGLGYNELILDGNSNSRLFRITEDATDVEIRNLSIINCSNSSAQTNFLQNGGAIYAENGGTFILKNIKFENNINTTSNSQGGALYCKPIGGYIFIDSCLFFNSQTKSWGAGASINGSPDSATINNCWFKDNMTEFRGGGLYSNCPIFSVINTTFSGNEAEDAAIAYFTNSASEVNFSNCTFSNNIASDPDRNFRSTGDLKFTNCTFKGNNEPIFGFAALVFQNNIIDNSGANFAPSNNGVFISNGGNISSDNSMASFLTGTNDQNNTNPMLDVLADNGGIMYTHQLLAGSPGIDNSVNSPSISTDQIGTQRDVNHDSGSMEYGSCSTVYATQSVTACFSYTWIDGVTYTENNQTSTFNIIGGAISGCDSIVTLDLTINQVNTGVTQSGDTLISNALNGSYKWLDCNNGMSEITGENNRSFYLTSPGSYAVEVTQDGCIDTSACRTVNGVGIFENSNTLNYYLYPNPTQDGINISFEENQDQISISLYSIHGKLIILKEMENTNHVNLDTPYPQGSYILKMVNHDNKIKYSKIIIE